MSSKGLARPPLTDEERSDTVAAYASACAFFGEQLATVVEEDWDRTTPCEEWDVISLVTHVVAGEALVTRVLRDGGSWDLVADPSILGGDPLAAWRGTALAALEAASNGSVLDMLHSHSAGVLSGGVIVGFRVTENLVHGWDLARACGTSVELPEVLAESCLDFWLPVAENNGAVGGLSSAFGAPVMPPDEASASVRLLSLLGRTA